MRPLYGLVSMLVRLNGMLSCGVEESLRDNLQHGRRV